MSVEKIVLVGTVCNVSHSLEREIQRVAKALSNLDLVGIFLVESDSKDNTCQILSRLSKEMPNFNYISLGDLYHKIPDRVSRIRFCRNRYVEYIRDLSKSVDFNYVAIADLDGMNFALSSKGVDSSFCKDGWGAVLANQTGGYYDLLALRHPEWCPNDVLHDLRELQEKIVLSEGSRVPFIASFRRRLSYDKARKNAIYSRMHVISKNSDWIEVESGFGGFGIYKASVFLNHNYNSLSGQEALESEHVSLSKRMREDNLKIYINPRLINNRWNTYNINRFFLVRQLRQYYWNSTLRKILTKK